MRFLNTLFGWQETNEAPLPETESVRLIAKSLDDLEPNEARFVAAFAYLLGRVAQADHHTSAVEIQRMEQVLGKVARLTQDQRTLAVQIAQNRAELFGFTEDYAVAREFVKVSDRRQREDLVHCLFAVAAADDGISGQEDAVVWQIASELEFSQREFIALRSTWNDKRNVIRDLPS